MEKKHKLYLQDQLITITGKFTSEELHQSLSHTNILLELKHARKFLINIWYQANELRLQHLDCKQTEFLSKGKTTKAKILQNTIQREQQQKCCRFFKVLRKGTHSQGGISHEIIPAAVTETRTKYTTIQDKEMLDLVLLQRNIDHFQQAKYTPFAQNSMIERLGEDGCNSNTRQ
jgi:hypothetical protein